MPLVYYMSTVEMYAIYAIIDSDGPSMSCDAVSHDEYGTE